MTLEFGASSGPPTLLPHHCLWSSPRASMPVAAAPTGSGSGPSLGPSQLEGPAWGMPSGGGAGSLPGPLAGSVPVVAHRSHSPLTTGIPSHWQSSCTITGGYVPKGSQTGPATSLLARQWSPVPVQAGGLRLRPAPVPVPVAPHAAPGVLSPMAAAPACDWKPLVRWQWWPTGQSLPVNPCPRQWQHHPVPPQGLTG